MKEIVWGKEEGNSMGKGGKEWEKGRKEEEGRGRRGEKRGEEEEDKVEGCCNRMTTKCETQMREKCITM